MVSFFATAQEWHHPFGWRDPREFGIKNDSSADATAGFRAMMAAFPSKGGTAIIPPGKYRVSDSVVVPSSVNIIGEGGDNTQVQGSTNEGTNFYFSSATKNFFIVQANPVTLYSSQNRFENFTIWNVSAGATAGSGIYIYNGEGFILRNISVLGFWDDITIRAGNIYTLENCKVFNYVNTGLTMGNNNNADLGDMTITGMVFATGAQSAHQPLAGLLWLGSGGLKMSNSKFNAGALGTTRNKYGICLTGSDGNTSDMLFSNISIENFDSSAIYSLFVNQIRGLVFDNIQTFGPTSKGSAINLGCVSLGTGSGLIGISNYVLGTYGSGAISQPAIKINNLNQISIGTGIITDYTSTNSITNSTNVSVYSGYNVAGQGGMTLTNTNTAGRTSYISTSDTYSGEIGSRGSATPTYGDLVANAYYIYSGNPAGIAIMADANAPITLSTGNGAPATERIKITGTGNVTIVGSVSHNHVNVAGTGTYSATGTDYTIEFTGSTATLAYPTVNLVNGRELELINYASGSITIPSTKSGNAATIIALTTGQRAIVQYDLTNTTWVIKSLN